MKPLAYNRASGFFCDRDVKTLSCTKMAKCARMNDL